MLRSGLRGVLALLLVAAPSFAVLIDSGDGTGNTSAPPDDPGWERLGTRSPCPPACGLTLFYLGQGWVLTARHVSTSDFRSLHDGAVYEHVEGSTQEIVGPNGAIDAKLYRVRGAPDLPLYPIARTPPPTGSEVVMIGRGQSRGDRREGEPPRGWYATSPARLRWGTNRIDMRGSNDKMKMFLLRFDWPHDIFATEHEAQATTGDSGGPVFVKVEGRWELAGIMVNASQPIYGDGVTGAVDLAFYRAKILRIVTGEPGH